VLLELCGCGLSIREGRNSCIVRRKIGVPETFAADYWEERKNILYYQVVRILVDDIGQGAASIIDVGSAGCPYVDWFPSIPIRSSIDLRRPYVASGVRSFTGDFLDWEPDRRYDVVTCLQVLEHVPNAASFAQKLLSIGNTVVVSVPYKWPEGHTKSHVHDPVDETKMRDWFGREPNFSYICTELLAPVTRLVQVYESSPNPWRGLNQRRRRIEQGAERAAKKAAERATSKTSRGVTEGKSRQGFFARVKRAFTKP
jgi:hypothetical protein